MLIWSPSLSFNALVQGKPVAGGHIDCEIEDVFLELVTCCWWEDAGDYSHYVCQTCTEDGRNCAPVEDCPFPCEKSSSSQPSGPFAPLQDDVLEQPPTAPPSGPAAPLQGGVLEQLEPSEGFQQGFFERQELQPAEEGGEGAQPLTRGQGSPFYGIPPVDQGAAELPPPATEETQPATVEEEQPVPVCQEGLEFNEDLGFCVPTECPEGQVLDEESGICVLEEQPVEQQEQAAEEPEDEQQQTEENQSPEESGSEDGSNN